VSTRHQNLPSRNAPVKATRHRQNPHVLSLATETPERQTDTLLSAFIGVGTPTRERRKNVAFVGLLLLAFRRQRTPTTVQRIDQHTSKFPTTDTQQNVPRRRTALWRRRMLSALFLLRLVFVEQRRGATKRAQADKLILLVVIEGPLYDPKSIVIIDEGTSMTTSSKIFLLGKIFSKIAYYLQSQRGHLYDCM
jgi:hypothetical protein